jgi:isopenicillin N synthase-like dioxygenase
VETGFAILSDTPLYADVIERGLVEAKAFFALPEAMKLAYTVQGGGGQRRYTAFGTEAAKDASEVDLKEFWHVGREGAADPRMEPNLWPSELPEFRPAMLAFFQALDDLGQDVLRAVALFLKLAPDFFEAPTRHGNSVLRLLHYPPMRNAAPGVRAAAHGDINVVTLLLGAEKAGLQALTRDGR